MAILLLSEIFPPKVGGSGRWFWEVYRRMPRDSVVIAAGENSRQEAFDRTHDLRIARVPLALQEWGIRSVQGLRGYWQALRKLRPLLKKERITRIHCGRTLPEGLLALALKFESGVPYVCYAHGEEVNIASGSRELRWLTRRVLKGTDFMIVNSHNTSQLLQQDWGLSRQRIRLMHPGVDCGRFVPALPDPVVRKRLRWDQRFVVLTVGRLQKRKGHDQMILALKTIRRSISNVLYAILGDGEERPFLEKLAEQEGVAEHVQFLGELPETELVPCYQQCDLFALPNRQVGKDIEGFGMVLLEAQACGRPVVAGASGGTAETMRIPQTGRVVGCDGPHELAALIIELASDPYRLGQMGKAARAWVAGHFDWTALSRQAEQVFQSTRNGACRAKALAP